VNVIRRDPNKGFLDTLLWVPKKFINVEGVKNALSFALPERDGLNVFTLYKETADHLLVPREFWKPADLDFPIVDCRVFRYQHVKITSRIKLDHLPDNNGVLQPTGKTLQRDALHALLGARGGILQLACGKGKTIIFLEYIARMKVPALIVIDNTQLLGQWQKEIARHLDVPGGVGLIQGDVFDWKHSVVMTTYQTLSLRADTFPEEARRWFGVVGWDEGHHVAAPTFSKTADLFSGVRLLLTATPERDDGQHVIYRAHIGEVIYKDLRQDLKPCIYFKWTGLKLDDNSALVRQMTKDRNGEMHIGKVASYLGQWQERLDLILGMVRDALSNGRKVLVLSKSIDELVNLYALWLNKPLYTDIKPPTPADVGETLPPLEIDERQLRNIYRQMRALQEVWKDTSQHPAKRQNAKSRLDAYELSLKQHTVWKKIDAIQSKKQKAYVKELVGVKTNAGLMIHQVSPEIRSKLIATKDVVFAVVKYGREGLDSPELDTVIACEPMSSKNGLQQLLGRILRKRVGKNRPVAVFLEDDIGPMIGMCNNLRRHLREWAVDEGGPYEYECVDHPTSFKRQGKTWTKNTMTFGL
jgi:superfamily II DNA or RNA helicase